MSINLMVNGTSLQSTNFVTSTIGDDTAPSQSIDLVKITRLDGEKLLSTSFNPKTITIAGRIKGSSLADLENQIDMFKKAVTVTEGRLDIQYAGNVRRWVISTQSVSIERAGYHVTIAPFSVSFVTYDPPFARNITGLDGQLSYNEALSVLNQNVQAFESTISFDGSAQPRPIITYIIDTANNLDTITEQVIGKKNILSVSTAFTSGDQLVFDTEKNRVLLNGRQINFEGVFPEYDLGDNTVLSKLYDTATIINAQQTLITDFVAIDNDLQKQSQSFLAGATTTYFLAEVYMRRDLLARLGTVTLSIQTAVNHIPTGVNVTNASKTLNVTDIPVDGGYIPFRFATAPTLTSGTQYCLVVQTTNLSGGKAYIGIAKSEPYADGRRAFTNNGRDWRLDRSSSETFRVWKNTTSIQWSVDKKITYVKRFL
jgi:hypothetical protein